MWHLILCLLLVSARKLCKKFDPDMAQQILGPDWDTICFDTDGIPDLFGKDNVGKQMSRYCSHVSLFGM